MSIELHLAERLYSTRDVVPLLLGSLPLRSEPTGLQIELSELLERVEQDRAASKSLGASFDRAYAPLLHAALRDLPRRWLLDPRLWHWLCFVPLREYVLARWCGGIEAKHAVVAKPSALEHFVGGASLVGFSRNAAARLYFGADASWQVQNDYGQVDVIFANTDLYTGIFERKLALSSPAVVALSGRLIEENEETRRMALKSLNFVLTTTALEALEADEVINLTGELIALNR